MMLKNERIAVLPALVLWLVLVPPTLQADSYADARADLVAAYQAEDFAAMRTAADASLEARPEFPGALFNLAFAESLDGDADAAMETLGRLIEKQIDYGVENIEAFITFVGTLKPQAARGTFITRGTIAGTQTPGIRIRV